MLEVIAPILIVVSVVLILMLAMETWAYWRHRKEVMRYAAYAQTYAEAAEQFALAFEAIKSTINYNADIQREAIDKINTHNKTLMAMSAVLDIHDRALSLGVWEKLSLEESILPPKNEEE